jgi:hypothetical protein
LREASARAVSDHKAHRGRLVHRVVPVLIQPSLARKESREPKDLKELKVKMDM